MGAAEKGLKRLQGWMGKAEERDRMDRVGLLPESVIKYGLRGCPWLSVMSRWLRASLHIWVA